jgi:hypothetical protein
LRRDLAASVHIEAARKIGVLTQAACCRSAAQSGPEDPLTRN